MEHETPPADATLAASPDSSVGETPLPATPTGGMQVLESRVYRGPNPYGYRPVIRFKIDLGPLEEYPSTRLPGFTDRLLALIPSLDEHTCSYDEPGGLVRRMREGTWLGHVSEHVAMELQSLAGTPVTYGKTRSTGERPGVYNVIYSYLEERVGLLAGWLALRLVDSLLPPEFQGVRGLELLGPRDTPPLAPPEAPVDLQAELEALTRLADRMALGPTTQSLVDARSGAISRSSGWTTAAWCSSVTGNTRSGSGPASPARPRTSPSRPPATRRSPASCSGTWGCRCRARSWSAPRMRRPRRRSGWAIPWSPSRWTPATAAASR